MEPIYWLLVFHKPPSAWNTHNILSFHACHASIYTRTTKHLTINSLKWFVTAHAQLTLLKWYNLSSAHARKWLFTALCLSPSIVRRLRCMKIFVFSSCYYFLLAQKAKKLVSVLFYYKNILLLKLLLLERTNSSVLMAWFVTPLWVAPHLMPIRSHPQLQKHRDWETLLYRKPFSSNGP